MKKAIMIGVAIVGTILGLSDMRLLTASINACSMGEPLNLAAVVAAGIPLIEGRFSTDTPEWVVLLCANASALLIYMPGVIVVACCLRWLKARKKDVEPGVGR